MASLVICARPYAQAAFDYAKQHKTVLQWEKSLKLLSDIVTHDAMQAALLLPGVATTQLADMLIDILGKQGDKAVYNFIRVIAEYKKLSLLPVIEVAFQAIKREDEQCVLATLVSAKPVDNTMQKQILAKLEKRFGQTMILASEIDESLIGGIKVHIGDEVIDGSLRGQLTRLKYQLRH